MKGRIVGALEEAQRLREKLLKDGMDPQMADRIVGQGLKAVLNPENREWRYLCKKCKDTGWITVPPSPEEKARLHRLYGPQATYQDYLVKCDADCQWLRREREKRRKKYDDDTDDFPGKSRRR